MAGSPLTVTSLSALRAGEKLSAGRSLYLRCANDGSITSTLRIKRAGRLLDLKVGTYEGPFNKAVVARIWREADALRENADQQIARKEAAASTVTTTGKLGADATLQQVWQDYLRSVQAGGRWTERNTQANKDRVSRHFASWAAWQRPLRELDAAAVAAHLTPITKETPAQGKKLRGLLSLICTHAIGLKILDASPVDAARTVIVNALPTGRRGRHHHAIVDIKRLRTVLDDIANLAGSPSTRNCLRLQAFTATRSGEAAGARWEEFDLTASVWRIPRARMKVKDATRGPHVLHLPPQVATWLGTLPRHDSGYVFPGRSGEAPVHLNAISQAFRRDLGLEGEMVPHGWRAALKTLGTRAMGGDGRPLFAPAWIEAVLDHQPADDIEAAYDRGGHVEGAGRVLAWWAAELTGGAQ